MKTQDKLALVIGAVFFVVLLGVMAIFEPPTKTTEPRTEQLRVLATRRVNLAGHEVQFDWIERETVDDTRLQYCYMTSAGHSQAADMNWCIR